MDKLFGNVLQQIILVVFYVAVIVVAVKLGISKAKKKNLKVNENSVE